MRLAFPRYARKRKTINRAVPLHKPGCSIPARSAETQPQALYREARRPDRAARLRGRVAL